MAKKRVVKKTAKSRKVSRPARPKRAVAKHVAKRARKKAAKKTTKKVSKKAVKKAVKKTGLTRTREAVVAPALVVRAAGFDCGSYPGDDAIRAWATNSPYEFVGFYFDAPCHTTHTFTTWSGKSSFVMGEGLGLAVVYVGLQQDGCGSTKVSRANGIAHGQDTVAKFTTEGFAAGTVVFLDVENYNGALSADMEAYIRGWISALLDDGTVGPGIYCPASKANAIRVAAQKEYASHGLPDGAPAFWIVKATDSTFDPDTSSPTECGVAFANVWQGRIDTNETHGGFSIGIDQNVADSRNPSGASHST